IDDRLLEEDMQKAYILTELANDACQRARLEAVKYSNPLADPSAVGFDSRGPIAIISFIDRVRPYLDNGELIDLSEALSAILLKRGDQALAVACWRAGHQLLEKLLTERAAWTKDERRLITAIISDLSMALGGRLTDASGAMAGQPYYDIATRRAIEVIDSFDWNSHDRLRYVQLRAFERLSVHARYMSEKSQILQGVLRAKRLCASSRAERFGRLQSRARLSLAILLNNCASAFGSLQAATEALQLAAEWNAELEGVQKAGPGYVAAFAAWQVARLTPADGAADRLGLGR